MASPAVSDLRRAFHGRAAFAGPLIHSLNAKQRAFVSNRASRRKLYGTRRGGKTRVIGALLLLTAQPNRESAYCSLTVGHAKATLWPELRKMEREFNITLDYNGVDNSIVTPNGGKIVCYGLSTEPDAEKLRGAGRVLGVIDEMGAQSEKIVKYALRETLGPSCMDYYGIGGEGIVLSGTATRLMDTFWHEQLKAGIAGNDPNYYHLSIRDNPFFAGRAEQAIAQYLADNNMEPGSAAARREVDPGEFCLDSEGVIYGWNGVVFPEPSLPVVGQTLMAIDYGKNTAALVVGRVAGGLLYILEAVEIHGNTLQKIVDETRRLQFKWKVGEMIGDSADGIAVKSMHDQYGFNIIGAKKRGSKEDRIWMLDSALKSNTVILGPETQPLQVQLRSLLWNEEHTDHHPNQPDHCCDATHYLMELVASFTKPRQKPQEPAYGTPEWMEREEKRMLEQVMKQHGLRADGSRH